MNGELISIELIPVNDDSVLSFMCSVTPSPLIVISCLTHNKTPEESSPISRSQTLCRIIPLVSDIIPGIMSQPICMGTDSRAIPALESNGHRFFWTQQKMMVDKNSLKMTMDARGRRGRDFHENRTTNEDPTHQVQLRYFNCVWSIGNYMAHSPVIHYSHHQQSHWVRRGEEAEIDFIYD